MEKKHIVNLSIDARLFEEGSAVSKRFIEYGNLFERFDAVVYTKPGYVAKDVSARVRIYPTNTRFKIFYFFDAYRIARRIVTSSTIVSSQEAMTNIVGLWLSKKSGARLQVQIHTDIMSPLFRKESWKNYLRYRLYLIALKKAHFVRVVSQHILDSIKGIITCPPERAVVLPLFVDKEALMSQTVTVDLQAKYPYFTFILLMASRFEVEKNIHMALSAFKKVIKKYPHAGLVLVGKGKELPKIRHTIRKLHLTKNVVIEEWTSSLSSYYKTAQAFLSSSNYEGYGMTLIEAALLRLPIVTTDVGVARDVFEHDKDILACKAQDEECFTRHVMHLIENNFLRETLMMNAQAKAESYLMTKDAYLKAYQAMFSK